MGEKKVQLLLHFTNLIGSIRILIRMVAGSELSILLLDLVLGRGGGHTENRVEVFVLRHGAQYVLSRSTASRRHALAGAVDR